MLINTAGPGFGFLPAGNDSGSGDSGTTTGGSTAGAIIAIGQAVASLLHDIGIGGGCGQTCIQATQYANQAGDLLTQNAQAYFSLPVPRPKSAQRAALANAQQIWNGLLQACSNPALNDAGRRCISDRQAGGCVWRVPQSQAGPQFPGGPGPGECFNWWNALIDVIAQDPNVYDDSVTIPGFRPTAGSSSPGLAIAGAALLLLAVASASG